jgi:hypothetical protein
MMKLEMTNYREPVASSVPLAPCQKTTYWAHENCATLIREPETPDPSPHSSAQANSHNGNMPREMGSVW